MEGLPVSNSYYLMCKKCGVGICLCDEGGDNPAEEDMLDVFCMEHLKHKLKIFPDRLLSAEQYRQVKDFSRYVKSIRN